MEEDGPIKFKALRAKFQEEALLAQAKANRPAVAEKPKHLPPPGGPSGSGTTPVAPRAMFRDGLRASGGKRPISFPPQETPPSSGLANGDGPARNSLKDRHMPLVLPALPAKGPPAEREPVKVAPAPAPPRTKKVLLLPFKSAAPPKVSDENGEEPTYADLTNRPSSVPSELPSLEKRSAEEGDSLRSEPSTSEIPLSSPDVPITPPSSVRSPDFAFRDRALPLPPGNPNGLGADVPAPPLACLPHLACISARPFFKASNPGRRSPFEKQLLRNKVGSSSPKSSETPPPLSFPLKKPLPDPRTLGPSPVKPPRPAVIDLSGFSGLAVKDVTPDPVRAPSEEPQPVQVSFPSPVLEAPEFPNFEDSEMETAGDETVDVASSELEASDAAGSEVNTPVPSQIPDPEASKPHPSVTYPAACGGAAIAKDLNLGSPDIIPLDPASFPEPVNLSGFPEPSVLEQRSHCEEAAVDSLAAFCIDESDTGPAGYQSTPEETELSSQAMSNDDIQVQSSAHQQDRYFESCDNVYEDVESINRFVSGHVSSKRRGGLKNPYADNYPKKEEPSNNKWPRNPCREHLSPVSADHKEKRKREKHRLEKERKEQKEREKKENEMKKKFKVTGEEEPMYHAKVMVANKVRKNDLPVRSGDTVSIIRTTNCPKGKWLARDANHKYGYISVMNVELNIKEMLELGKKAQVAGRGGNLEADTISIGSRSSSHPVLTSSFTDDSEEWDCEDNAPLALDDNPFLLQIPPGPEIPCFDVAAQHTLSDASLEDLHTQCPSPPRPLMDSTLKLPSPSRTRHEALQKLAFFFQHSKAECADVPGAGRAALKNTETSSCLCAVEEPPYPEQEVDFTELELLPPPPLYADD
ncbi:uncharacterized protein ACNS7B_020489 [Menidia menidia]